MSLSTNVSDLATRVATEIKAVRTLVNGNAGDLAALTTDAKTSLVAAINELQLEVNAAAGGGVAINDAAPTSTTSTYSASKIEAVATREAGEAAGALINDTTASVSTVYSSTRTNTAISNAIAALIDSSPGTLDTLNELAAALGDDPNFASTVTTALGQRVAVTAQTFTAGEQTQARTNIGAASAVDVGPTSTNYVTTFEAGLV